MFLFKICVFDEIMYTCLTLFTLKHKHNDEKPFQYYMWEVHPHKIDLINPNERNRGIFASRLIPMMWKRDVLTILIFEEHQVSRLHTTLHAFYIIYKFFSMSYWLLQYYLQAFHRAYSSRWDQRRTVLATLIPLTETNNLGYLLGLIFVIHKYSQCILSTHA